MAVRSNVRSGSDRPRQPREPKSARPPRNNDRLVHDMVAVFLLGLGCFTIVSLLAWTHSGQIGHVIEVLLRLMFGVGAFFAPFSLIYAGMLLVWGGRLSHVMERLTIGSACIALLFLAIWHYAHTTTHSQFDPHTASAYGGYLGAALSAGLRSLFGVGTPIVFSALLLGVIVWASDIRLLHLARIPVRGAQVAAVPARHGVSLLTRLHRDWRRRRQSLAEAGLVNDAPKPGLWNRAGRGEAEAPSQYDDFDEDSPTVNAASPLAAPPVAKPRTSGQKPPAGPLAFDVDRLGEVVDSINKEYKLPPVSLLSPAPPPAKKLDSAVAQRQTILMQTLHDFKIGGNVQQVAMGPTVTRFEVQLEPGILVKKIVALADNLAMSLAAIDVRVEAPIPGKAAIGIEVPNDVVQTVTIRECLETSEFINSPSKLTFALGKDVAGEFKYADLARMPHLLIGGSTNSGKSVCLNTIITSILYRATPREVRFVMIDPKRVELSLYDGIPHLLSPVIKDTRQAAGIFRSVLQEMDSRYTIFSRRGTRNLDGYNEKVAPEDRLPYIVVIVDELADLMMTQRADVETSICRLAQLARATGIHLVIATQRPSVDVITGTIKANISSRIAFAVATQVDSRTILDGPGADRLIGRGDMLFLPIDANKPLRIQGCFVGEKETDALVEYLKSQEEPRYTMLPSETSSGDGERDNAFDERDELFEPCVRWLVQQRTASTSSLQRRFKIGYTRAARLIETMEALSLVGSQDGVKPREVLLSAENVESYFAGKQQGVVEE